VTFFNSDTEQSLDLEAHKTHILWMSRAGVVGFLVQGSTAEAVTLTTEERDLLTRTTRDVLDANGFKHVLVIVGCGAQSTAEALALAAGAAKSGGDHVIVLPPSYFAAHLTTQAVEAYYTEIADKSPLPVLIYSYPGASGGLEITSDSLATLSTHPNIVGVKQTDHNVGKMARVYHQTHLNNFIVLGGASDYLLGALAVGAIGTITGVANVTPRVLVKLFELFEAGKMEEARELQGAISLGEWALLQGGIPSIKASTELFLGRGGIPRRPIPASPEATVNKLKTSLGPLYEMELALESAAKTALYFD